MTEEEYDETYIILAGCLIGLIVTWGIWHIWCWVLPQIYPTGPEPFIRPNFWLFCAAVVLISWMRRIILGINNDW